MKNLGRILIAISLSFATVPHASAQVRCYSLFSITQPYLYKASRAEIKALYKAYPKIKDNISKMYNDIVGINMAKNPVTTIEEIQQSGTLRSYTVNDTNKPDWIQNMDADLKKQIIDAHNQLTDKQAFATYLTVLYKEAAVYMMKNKDQPTSKIADFKNSASAPLTEKTTKEEFLLNGIIDHHSLAKVLVNRIRSRGDRIAVIPQVGFTNTTKTQNFPRFYQVPARGPFFDRVFGRLSGHGQEVHLLQMDYVEGALTNREQFWHYSTKENRGDWVWDSLFDGMNRTIMHPEYIGPILRKHIPLY
ncbi:hypothetical protein K2P97_01015 [bacterium]|nr:hypothetical protein [bacterium]